MFQIRFDTKVLYSMPKKRLASIRRGIRYQDLVACEAVLDLFGSGSNTPMWVELEKASSGKFDDVVVGYPSKIVHRQVKWAANPGGQPLTLGHFSSTTTKRKTALVKAYSESWSQIKLSGQTFELEFVTNRAPDSEFQGFLSGQSSKIKTKLTNKQRETLDATWRNLTSLNKTKFKEFDRAVELPSAGRGDIMCSVDTTGAHSSQQDFECSTLARHLLPLQ